MIISPWVRWRSFGERTNQLSAVIQFRQINLLMWEYPYPDGRDGDSQSLLMTGTVCGQFFRSLVVIKGKPVRAIVPEERGDNWIPAR